MSAWKPTVFGHADLFEQFDHALPRVHAAPADFAFGGEALAVAFGDFAGFAERLRRSSSCCPSGSFVPVGRRRAAESMRTTPYGRTPSSRSFSAMRQAFAHLLDELLALVVAAHRRAAAGAAARPARRREPTTRPLLANFVGELLDAVVGRCRCSMCGSKRKRSTPSNFTPLTSAFGGEVEHRVEVDERVRRRAAFADEAGPHGVVEFGKVV